MRNYSRRKPLKNITGSLRSLPGSDTVVTGSLWIYHYAGIYRCSRFGVLARLFCHSGKSVRCRRTDPPGFSSVPAGSYRTGNLVRRCTSPNYCGWWTPDCKGALREGNFAMSILYSNYASDLSAHSSHVVGMWVFHDAGEITGAWRRRLRRF